MTREQLLNTLREDVVEAAKALLGAELVRGPLRARIVETEAYRADDPACHAFGKNRMKNMALFGEPGDAYIYFAYGNHWMLNVVAHAPGEAAAVLIRAAEPIAGLDEMAKRRCLPVTQAANLLSGPGKLAQAFGITSSENSQPLIERPASERLSILPPEKVVGKIWSGPRVGIAEGKWHDVPWRFVEVEKASWASHPKPRLQ
jgi:DNA-3-methyladenine glycosylase